MDEDDPADDAGAAVGADVVAFGGRAADVFANVQHLDGAAQRRRLAEACYEPEATEPMFGK